MPARKNREPSKCREWERERRNRLNEAFSQLAALLTEHSSDPEAPHGKGQANMAKIEIIQRAIVFLKDLIQQKLQLDAKVLAAQVEVKGYMDTHRNRKDVSTQVNKQLHPKTGGPKKKKLWKETVRKEKPISLTLNDVNKQEMRKPSTPPVVKLPKLLPKVIASEKDGQSSTVMQKKVVMLPATPYILPQRPLVIPPAPPTFFLLEPFPGSTRSSLPILPRVVSEITKTTMVNNIPIAAYSFPLSVAKNKKNKTKDNLSVGKKCKSQKRKLKVFRKSKKLLIKNQSVHVTQVTKSNSILAINSCSVKEDNHNTVDISCKNENVKVPPSQKESQPKQSNLIKDIEKEILPTNEPSCRKTDASVVQNSRNNLTKHISLKADRNGDVNFDEATLETKAHHVCSDTKKINAKPENQDKNKIQSMLDPTICDNTVDGGNARLELAEEFLAASPTAAFLMTFPLVSGVRTDSPADDEHHALPTAVPAALPVPSANRPTQHKRDAPSSDVPPIDMFYDKSAGMEKPHKKTNPSTLPILFNEKQKLLENTISSNPTYVTQSSSMVSNSVGDHTFLNLLPPIPPAAASENVFSLDFDGNFPKNTSSSHSYINSNNMLFKNDPFTGKSNNLNIYSNSNLSTSHEFNGFGLYPCAVEKYSNKINKSEHLSTEDNNFMKIGSARLGYELDLSLPQKTYEFTCNATVSNISKENVFTPVTTFSSTSYNPFNSDFHMQLATSSGNNSSVMKTNIKSNQFYTDTITNLYSQPSTLWPEEYNLYGNNTVNATKASNVKQHNYNAFINQNAITDKCNKNAHIYDTKTQSYHNVAKPSKLEVNQLITDKNNKKSPTKTHINWMTSEVRSSQSNQFDLQSNEYKDQSRIQFPGTSSSALLPHLDYNTCKKFDHMETNFFPMTMPSLSSHVNQEEIQLWPSARPLGTAEIGLDPPPINLPTLVGDLALGPHERRKSVDRANRGVIQTELPSCNNFLSVTQLMNRCTDAPAGRSHTFSHENHKPPQVKNDHPFTYPNPALDKPALGHIETDNMQPCYFFNESKPNSAPGTGIYSSGQTKQKSHKVERSKSYKNNYSAEALLKSANSAHKVKSSSQKYGGYTANQESQAAQVSHFPSIADYPPDPSYSQPYAGTGLYTAGTGGSLYGNLMASGGGGGGSVAAAYAPSNFTPDFVDYGPVPDCNFTYPRFDNFKIKNLPDASSIAKVSLDVTRTAKDTTVKHKNEYAKKDLTKNVHSKRPKLTSEIDGWGEALDASLQSKQSKKSSYNMVTEELTFSNYLTNQVQMVNPVYSHHAATATPGAVAAAALASAARPSLHCPTNAARTNFNLSTLFPEIAKVQWPA